MPKIKNRFFWRKKRFSLTRPCKLVKFLTILIPMWRIILMQEYEDLKTLVAEIEADISKAEGGNKAAGTRVRKQMQKVKQASQNVRNRVLEIRSVP
jgi:hypothetical protein